MIPNKYRGVSFDKTQQISRFIGKSWTAGRLVILRHSVLLLQAGGGGGEF